MGNLYRVNPTCPFCGEEHMYWVIKLSDEDEAQIKKFEEKHKGENFLKKIFSGPAVIVQKKFEYGMCKREFYARCGVMAMDALDYHDPNCVKIGEYPV